MPVLTGIDVLGVQRFVFASNRLRDMVTGSFLVHWSTSCKGGLSGLVAENNILLADGGNAIVEFASLDEAKAFAGAYTRLLYDQVPGLDVVLVHETFENGNLAVALQNVHLKMACAKADRLPSVPLLGLSVTASCMETGFPATVTSSSESTAPLSRGIQKRREKKVEVNRYWIEYLNGLKGLAFPLELDQLGRTMGDTSQLGVVHVDGNGVGVKIKKWLSEKKESDDDTVRQEYRELSQAIVLLGKEALQAVVHRICMRVPDLNNAMLTGVPKRLGFELKKVDGEWMLPLRPILLGGDDLTFVCDGRIALDLAETALSIFDNSEIPHLSKITASAGIAIVRVHAPFARAYELSEKLCRSAKGKLKENNDSGCALDWHIGIARPGETMKSIRDRQYQINGSESPVKDRLTCRPYLLGSGKDDENTWRWLSGMLLDDKDCGLRGDAWSERRNKVKALAELVHEGPKGVQSSLDAWRVVDNKLQLPKSIEENNKGGFFDDSRTPLLDAVELLDLHLRLEDAGHEHVTDDEETK